MSQGTNPHVSQLALWSSSPWKSCRPSILGPMRRNKTEKSRQHSLNWPKRDWAKVSMRTFPTVEKSGPVDQDMTPIMDLAALDVNLEFICITDERTNETLRSASVHLLFSLFGERKVQRGNSQMPRSSTHVADKTLELSLTYGSRSYLSAKSWKYFLISGA
jgi:hypothetical protein